MEIDYIWKALSDPTRRQILEFLLPESRNTTEIVEHFPDLTRFNVMKHLDVLRIAELVLTEEEGRKRINTINRDKVWLIYENWLSGFGQFPNSQLSREKEEPENRPLRISKLKKKKDFGWKRYN